jgi:hypothetical protein
MRTATSSQESLFALETSPSAVPPNQVTASAEDDEEEDRLLGNENDAAGPVGRHSVLKLAMGEDCCRAVDENAEPEQNIDTIKNKDIMLADLLLKLVAISALCCAGGTGSDISRRDRRPALTDCRGMVSTECMNGITTKPPYIAQLFRIANERVR